MRPVVLVDPRVDDFRSERLQLPERTRLVGLHEPAEADHVGGEDGGEPALDALRFHGSVPHTRTVLTIKF